MLGGVQGLKWNGQRLKLVFNAGALLWAAGGVGFWVLSPIDSWGIYGLAVLVGIGNAFILVRMCLPGPTSGLGFKDAIHGGRMCGFTLH